MTFRTSHLIVGGALCALLAASPQHADSLIAAVPEPAGEVTAALTMLELEGRVEQQPGKIFVLI